MWSKNTTVTLAQIRTSICEKTGAKTFPQILVGGEFVGGCTDLFDKWKAGEVCTYTAPSCVQVAKSLIPVQPVQCTDCLSNCLLVTDSEEA
jgi:hypothetical protein